MFTSSKRYQVVYHHGLRVKSFRSLEKASKFADRKNGKVRDLDAYLTNLKNYV